MTQLLLHNAVLVDIDPLKVERGSLRLKDGTITERGDLKAGVGDEVIDCNGAVVLPGLVNGHTHLYSALAVGMPSPPRNPKNFLEILELVWWRLDRALDAETVRESAHIGAIEALRCGTTTLIDHHASPSFIRGSLDMVEQGIASAGLRGVLCYEATDRHGHAGAEEGIAENERYLALCAQRRDGRFAGLVGAHASFTLEDRSMAALASLAERTGSGVHIHVAEDPCDEAACRRDYGKPLVERLGEFGLLNPRTVFAHGTHLDARAVEAINRAGLHLAHNTRSNMNNAVGYAPLGAVKSPVMLGTDGIGGDMFAESRTAWFKSRDAHAGLSPADIVAMLVNAARRASSALGVTLGVLQPGAAADIVITDYAPFTPIDSGNLLGHLLFGLSSTHVRHVLIGGRLAVRDRAVVSCDAPEAARNAQTLAADLWKRMVALR